LSWPINAWLIFFNQGKNYRFGRAGLPRRALPALSPYRHHQQREPPGASAEWEKFLYLPIHDANNLSQGNCHKKKAKYQFSLVEVIFQFVHFSSKIRHIILHRCSPFSQER